MFGGMIVYRVDFNGTRVFSTNFRDLGRLAVTGHTALLVAETGEVLWAPGDTHAKRFRADDSGPFDWIHVRALA